MSATGGTERAARAELVVHPAPGASLPSSPAEPLAEPLAAPTLEQMVAGSGLRRVLFLAWRDPDDEEAGGPTRTAASRRPPAEHLRPGG